jgi:hypothetical protein
VTRAVDFTGVFPELGPPQVYSDRVDHRFSKAMHAARMILDGGAGGPRPAGLQGLEGSGERHARFLRSWEP